MKRAQADIDWCAVDELDDGHGVEIGYRVDELRVVKLAFIVGYEWRRGAPQAEVQVLRDTAQAWIDVGAEASAVRHQLVEVVHDVLAGAPLTLTKGNFRVFANA